MSNVNTIALVAGPLIGAALGGIVEFARERQQTRAAAELSDRQTRNETKVRGWERRADDRARQSGAVRKWVSEQFIADTFAAEALVTLALHNLKEASGEGWLHSQAAVDALRTAIAEQQTKSRSDPTLRLENAVSGISDRSIITAVRSLATFNSKTNMPFQRRAAQYIEQYVAPAESAVRRAETLAHHDVAAASASLEAAGVEVVVSNFVEGENPRPRGQIDAVRRQLVVDHGDVVQIRRTDTRAARNRRALRPACRESESPARGLLPSRILGPHETTAFRSAT